MSSAMSGKNFVQIDHHWTEV